MPSTLKCKVTRTRPPAHHPSPIERHRSAVHTRLRAAGVRRSGPGSVSWKVNREIVVVAGWGRAILLQLAHPLVAAGVEAHSGFRVSRRARVARFRSTVDAMLSLTFGTDDEAATTAAGINLIHDRVLGRLHEAAGVFPAGTAYSAHHADLLRWVHATLVDSIPRAYAHLVGPLAKEELDRYCAEAAVMEPLLDIPTGTLPRTSTDLDTYMCETFASHRLVVTEGSRALARAVLFPPGWRLFWPAFRPVQLITIGLLPEAVRQAYGFGWTPKDARALARWTTGLRVVGRLLPSRLREWPCARRDAGAEACAPHSPEVVTRV